MNAVEIKGVSKRFKKTSGMTTLKSSFIQRLFSISWARANHLDVLKDIDLKVKTGTTLGIIGKNGSGKSTLLRLLAGIYKPTAGKIAINGRISALIELGAGFHPEFTGRENVFINGIILGLSKKKIRERFDEIVKFAGLEDFIDEPVRTYSSGMYMRLGFSVAVNVDPDILLIDEVLAVGDEVFAHKCKNKLDGFKQKGKTIIFVTHDLDTMENWCDEAVWLSDGVIKEFGTPKRVVDAYKKKVMEEEEKVLEAEHELMSERLAAKKGLGNKNRWGSREIEITSVKFLDVDNKERHVFNAGDSCFVEIEYKINREVNKPVFGIGISRPDGVRCYGTNTNIDKVDFKYNRKNGKVRFIFDSLDFLEGSYLFDIAVHASDGYAYDYHSRLYSLAVRSNIKDEGIFRPKHSWDFI